MYEAGPNPSQLSAEQLVHVSWPGKVTELIRGRLVVREPPGAQHGSVASRLTYYLGDFVYRKGLGVLFAQDTGFHIESNPDTVRAPDVAFLAQARAGALEVSGYARIAPDLVAEIVSPNDRPAEVRSKVADWIAAGVKLVWVIDPRRRMAHVHRSNGTVTEGATTLDGEDVLPGFTRAVDDLLL